MTGEAHAASRLRGLCLGEIWLLSAWLGPEEPFRAGPEYAQDSGPLGSRERNWDIDLFPSLEKHT